jgi:hypothetical protein
MAEIPQMRYAGAEDSAQKGEQECSAAPGLK